MKVWSAESYFTKHHLACCQHLRRYARRADNDDLHTVRVSIKRIKAVLTVVRDIDGLDVEAYFTPYKGIFHQAGSIRGAALIRDRLRKLSSDKKAIAHRTRLISALSKNLKDEIPLYLKDIDESTEDVLTALRVCDHDGSRYYRDLLARIRRKWRKKCINYHTLRKHLKQWLYSAELLRPGTLKKLASPTDLRRMDELQDLIGRWHDASEMTANNLSDVKDHDAVGHALHKEIKKLKKEIIRKGDKLWG